MAAEEATTSKPLPFGGGYNLGTAPSSPQYPEMDSPDCSNVINNINGEISKRLGSERYISQAVSTNPFVSVFRVYGSSGTETRKALLGTTKDLIVHSTTDTGGFWVTLASGLAHNQSYSGTMYNNRLVLTGSKLLNPILSYDLVNSTVNTLITGAVSFNLRSKYVFNSRNQLIAANVADITQGTTYYNSRAYYTEPFISTFTANRYLSIRENDGEEITGIGELNGMIHFWKANTITELDYTVLEAGTGNQALRTLIQGFGLFAPRTLANTGNFYIFGAKDGIRVWDGGRKTRLQVEQESRPIASDIQPLLDRLIKAGTYKDSVGYYYPKRQWYVFAYEDPDKSPRGKLNSVLIYDLNIGKWFPFKNWNANGFASFDGLGDNGELVFGDSADGYVHYGDIETSANDARKEISIHSMDEESDWAGSQQEVQSIVEGTGAIKMTLPTIAMASTVTYMGMISVGEWHDKTKITKADKFQFKVRTSSGNNIISLRMDLEINDVRGNFDVNFTSVTITSHSFISIGASSWTTVEINLSSFPILASWTDLGAEQFPFANTLTFFGIRFVSTGIAGANLYIDDLRLIQATENPLNAYWFTKQFNFDSAKDKTFYKLILNGEIPSDSVFYIDFYKDFGEFTSRVTNQGAFGKEIYVTGFGGSNNLSKVNSNDFTLIIQTATIQPDGVGAFALRPLVVDDAYIYAGDQLNNRIAKISKSTFSVFVTTYGSLGSQTTNFNLIYQLAADDQYLYVADFGNNRIKVHSKSDLEFVNAFGTLGQHTTSFHNPTGVAVDDEYIYVGNDGNYQIMKITKSTGGFVTATDLNLNTIGDITLAVDDQYLYNFYDWVDPTSLDHQQVILEKRFKSSLELVNKVTVYPRNTVAVSSYNIMGDISVSDDYIYLSFTDNVNGTGNYFIQKRLKSDFSIVKEYRSTHRHFAVSANGLAFNPKKKSIEKEIGSIGKYLQIRYSENTLDNNIKLFNQAFVVTGHNR